MTLQVICVLKTGGCYTPSYVRNLQKMVEAHLTIPFRFLCLSDVSDPNYIPLLNGRNGWWSKVEMFRFSGPTIYLDLDTALFGSLDNLAKKLHTLRKQQTFFMLRAFNRNENWASGVMAWTGDWSQVWRTLTFDDIQRTKWDQRYIRGRVTELGGDIQAIQDILHVYSYRKQCLNGVPRDADIVCFHGDPRPHEVGPPFFMEVY